MTIPSSSVNPPMLWEAMHYLGNVTELGGNL
jgi:hypothetical protein